MSEEKTHVLNKVSVKCNGLGVRSRCQRLRVSSSNKSPSLTKQADKDRACIHNILKKASQTGLLPQRVAQPLEGQLPDVESFHQAMTVVAEAHQAFDQLPSDIRHKFENNPSKMLQFVSDENNRDELKKMGLLAPEKVEQVLKVEMVNSPASHEQSAPHNAGGANETAPTGGK